MTTKRRISDAGVKLEAARMVHEQGLFHFRGMPFGTDGQDGNATGLNHHERHTRK